MQSLSLAEIDMPFADQVKGTTDGLTRVLEINEEINKRLNTLELTQEALQEEEEEDKESITKILFHLAVGMAFYQTYSRSVIEYEEKVADESKKGDQPPPDHVYCEGTPAGTPLFAVLREPIRRLKSYERYLTELSHEGSLNIAPVLEAIRDKLGFVESSERRNVIKRLEKQVGGGLTLYNPSRHLVRKGNVNWLKGQKPTKVKSLLLLFNDLLVFGKMKEEMVEPTQIPLVAGERLTVSVVEKDSAMYHQWFGDKKKTSNERKRSKSFIGRLTGTWSADDAAKYAESKSDGVQGEAANESHVSQAATLLQREPPAPEGAVRQGTVWIRTEKYEDEWFQATATVSKGLLDFKGENGEALAMDLSSGVTITRHTEGFSRPHVLSLLVKNGEEEIIVQTSSVTAVEREAWISVIKMCDTKRLEKAAEEEKNTKHVLKLEGKRTKPVYLMTKSKNDLTKWKQAFEWVIYQKESGAPYQPAPKR